ncbi:MAG: ribulose-phosphate 3-epimerase [Candidatus Woesearchaeota archaeon]
MKKKTSQTKNITIYPSVIAKTHMQIRQIYKDISFAKTLHLDVMDGVFVKNHSLLCTLSAVRKHACEAHLMVQHPLLHVRRFSFCKRVYMHVESENVQKAIALAKKLGVQVGLALSPKTPLKSLEQYTGFDSILLLTVNPGSYGAPYIASRKTFAKKVREQYPKKRIIIDGAMTPPRIESFIPFGITHFVMGSYLQKATDKRQTIRTIVQQVKENK